MFGGFGEPLSEMSCCSTEAVEPITLPDAATMATPPLGFVIDRVAQHLVARGPGPDDQHAPAQVAADVVGVIVPGVRGERVAPDRIVRGAIDLDAVTWLGMGVLVRLLPIWLSKTTLPEAPAPEIWMPSSPLAEIEFIDPVGVPPIVVLLALIRSTPSPPLPSGRKSDVCTPMLLPMIAVPAAPLTVTPSPMLPEITLAAPAVGQADDVVRGPLDEDAIAVVAQGHGSRGVGADHVREQEVPRRRRALDLDPVAGSQAEHHRHVGAEPVGHGEVGPPRRRRRSCRW